MSRLRTAHQAPPPAPRHAGPPAAALILALAAILALITAAATPAHADDAFARRITNPADLLDGAAADAELGDFLLANGNVAIIITDAGHAHGYSFSGGNIIDAAAAAVILAEGVDSGNSDLAVETRYILHPDDVHVTIETTFTNNGAAISLYSAGDVIEWDHAFHYVPGYGYEVTGIHTTTEWIGGAGVNSSYGYVPTSGNVSADHGSGWSDTIIKWLSLPAGGTRTYTRYLVPTGPGISKASDIIHELREFTVGTVEGTVNDWANSSTVPGATIDCLLHGDDAYTQVIADDAGEYSVTLPATDLELHATAPLFYPELEYVDVVAGTASSSRRSRLRRPSTGPRASSAAGTATA